MIKKFLKMIFLILVCFGIWYGISIAVNKQGKKLYESQKIESIFTSVQSKKAILTNFYTYGDTLNIEGKLTNISKDNFENAKIIVTDGENEKTVNLETTIISNDLYFSTSKINDAIELDELSVGNYYILFRIKLNNSAVPKLYFLVPSEKLPSLEYYTVTKNGQNKKINIEVLSNEVLEKEYEYLSIRVMNNILPEEVYDFVIDGGHGGKDVGERSGTNTEADIALEYSKKLKAKLEELGFKVKLTRDDNTSEYYTYTNMYDSNGRITVACKTKAKYMISFHVNNGNSNLTGIEIYVPTKCNLNFAKLMADKVVGSGANTYSNNSAFKEQDGVYVWNFTKSVISQFAKTAEKKGYEPYNITENTPYQYTIREVGGIATNAYADGRNKEYSKNEYYNSRQGIECYQIELGYIKTDLDKILYNQDAYISSISEAIQEYLEKTTE